MGRLTLRKGYGALYVGIGWKRCPKCGQIGFMYRYRGRLEVKHHTPIDQQGQVVFTPESWSTGLLMQMKRVQKTCYIPKRKAR